MVGFRPASKEHRPALEHIFARGLVEAASGHHRHLDLVEAGLEAVSGRHRELYYPVHPGFRHPLLGWGGDCISMAGVGSASSPCRQIRADICKEVPRRAQGQSRVALNSERSRRLCYLQQALLALLYYPSSRGLQVFAFYFLPKDSCKVLVRRGEGLNLSEGFQPVFVLKVLRFLVLYPNTFAPQGFLH